MTEPSKPLLDRPHTVRWDMDEWERIEEAARTMGERQHLDLGAVDVIRSGTRRLVEELLAAKDAEARSGNDRRKSA